jgi:hypothetical protein
VTRNDKTHFRPYTDGKTPYHKTNPNTNKWKRYKLIIIQKWAEEYQNTEFWELKLNQQSIFLKATNHYFNSIFDCANGGLPFYYKLYPLLNNKTIFDSLLRMCE